ncbi:MAG: DUF819 family protein [Crocinitomicaceae bacterium]
MKSILFLFISLMTAGMASAQMPKINWLDSSAVAKLEPGTFTYFNASAQSTITIEKSTDIFIDFAVMDVPSPIDSLVVNVGSNSTTFDRLQPFLLRNINSTQEFKIKAYSGGKSVAFASKNTDELGFKIKYSQPPLIVRDEIVFGLLTLILAIIFFTSHKQSNFWQKFYRIIPALLLCYVIPAFLVFFGWISPEYSKLYEMARDYLLPAALILMTLGIDFKAILNLGPKALIMFLTGTVGVILGGPIAILVYSMIDPSVVGGEGFEATWRGMSTIAGSWIGGGANQNAMYETYQYAPQLYGKMIVVDIVVANLWMAFLLFGASRAEKIDKWLKADSSSIEELKKRVTDYQSSILKQPTLTDYVMILGIAFGLVGLGHFGGAIMAEVISNTFSPDSPFANSFLWLVLIATTGGLVLSFTKLRKYEGAGASKIGSVFIYILVATIGMKMELAEAVKEPQLILVGIIWMIVHVSFMILIAKLIKAPFFFLAVGSQANIGGAASAPVVAAAFHPALASVGAIIAVLGYALGTYGAIVCAELMRWVAP